MNRKPNIVLCTADMLRPFETACCRHPVVETPAMARLSGEGPWFRVGCSNSPLCVPARSALLTGQYARTCTGTSSNFVGFPPARHRSLCPDPTLPEVLREHGYRTGLVGKWHLHPAPELVGFDEAVIPHNLHRHHGQAFYEAGRDPVVVEGFSLDYELERAGKFIRENRSGPFFLQYNLSPPHSPLADAPPRYTGRYRREQVILRDNVFLDGRMAWDEKFMARYLWDYLSYLPDNLEGLEAVMTEDYQVRSAERPRHGLKRVLRDLHRLVSADPELAARIYREMPYLDFEAHRQADLVELYRLYYGMTTCVDDYLGRLLEILESQGVSGETIVVFTSDHGDQLGSHHLWNKAWLYEESIRVPLMFRWPGRLPGREIAAQPGSLIDVMPTLLSLAGITAPPTVQGQDLSRVLAGEEETAPREAVFIEAYKQGAIGIRTPTALYGVHLEGGTEYGARPAEGADLFYDLEEDPWQFEGGTAGKSEIVEPLRRRLLEWHRATPWLQDRGK